MAPPTSSSPRTPPTRSCVEGASPSGQLAACDCGGNGVQHLLHAGPDRVVLLVAGQALSEDVLVAHVLAPHDATPFVEPYLERGPRLAQILDLEVELPPLVFDPQVQSDDQSCRLAHR